ncbi:ribosylnicotinamide kinase [Rhizophlyctis rosea]|nr:ribosylnicotinamide kinase [Rhizophlyctis rosea]
MDKFYKPSEQVPVVNGQQHWDCPEAIDMKTFAKTLSLISSNPSDSPYLGKNRPTVKDDDIPVSIVNHLKELIERTRIKALASKVDLKFILVDGFLLYVDKDVVDQLDVRFFLGASFETLARRRSERNGYITDAGFWVDPPDYFAKVVYPAYLLYNRPALDTIEKRGEDGDRVDGLIGLNSEELDIAGMVQAAVDRIIEYVDRMVQGEKEQSSSNKD